MGLICKQHMGNICLSLTVWTFLKNPLKYLKVSEFISRNILNTNFLASIYFKFGSLYRSYTQKESSEQ